MSGALQTDAEDLSFEDAADQAGVTKLKEKLVYARTIVAHLRPVQSALLEQEARHMPSVPVFSAPRPITRAPSASTSLPESGYVATEPWNSQDNAIANRQAEWRKTIPDGPLGALNDHPANVQLKDKRALYKFCADRASETMERVLALERMMDQCDQEIQQLHALMMFTTIWYASALLKCVDSNVYQRDGWRTGLYTL
ncbi:unnamed protein product [Peniophora sp. CBMAI 1063]|nr:unnamed protein product [Peniophora sp. CBMAI 1063]